MKGLFNNLSMNIHDNMAIFRSKNICVIILFHLTLELLGVIIIHIADFNAPYVVILDIKPDILFVSIDSLNTVNF